MSWKKNSFGYLMWVAYLLIIGIAMAFIGGAISNSFGKEEYYGMIAAAVYLLFAGVLVLGLHRMAVNLDSISVSGRKPLLCLEGIVVIVLFATGLFFRLMELPSASEESLYADLAYVAIGQEPPRFVHGAVHIYIRALHLLFVLLGNKAAAALRMQIVLQMVGVLFLYFAIRKMAGRFSAVSMLIFFMLSPYMVDEAVAISPKMLYLLIFSIVLLFVSLGTDYTLGWRMGLPAGVMAALLGYLDVTGILMVPVILGTVWSRREKDKRKLLDGTLGCVIGFLLGVVACVCADVLSSGKSARGIIQAWRQLYQWESLQLSVTVIGFGMVWVALLLLGFMAWGIYSFWCNRETERFSMWIFCLGSVVIMQCLGIFTKEIDGYCYIFLFSTILAGIGIRESIALPTQEKVGEDGETMELVEYESLGEHKRHRHRKNEEDESGSEVRKDTEEDDGAGKEVWEDIEEEDSIDENREDAEDNGDNSDNDDDEEVGEDVDDSVDDDEEAGEGAEGSDDEEEDAEEAGEGAEGSDDDGEEDAEEAGEGVEGIDDSEEEDGDIDNDNDDQDDKDREDAEKDSDCDEDYKDEERDKGTREVEISMLGKIFRQNKKTAVGKGQDIAGKGKKTVNTEEKQEKITEEKPEENRKIEFIENPLPLPKKHEKRVMNYKLDSEKALDGYDIDVDDDDDFDH